MSSQGPNNCGSGSDGSGGWVNPNNVALSGQHTTQSIIGFAGSSSLVVTNFGFNLPANATPVGMAMTFLTSGSGINIQDLAIQEIIAGGGVGPDHSDSVSTWSGLTTRTYGGPTDNWGNPTRAQVNANNFGILIACQNIGSGTRIAQINAFVTMTIYYSVPPTKFFFMGGIDS